MMLTFHLLQFVLFFFLTNILHGVNAALIHPIFGRNILKNLRDIAIESFIYSFFVLGIGCRLVYFGHQPIQKPHDLFIVISILAVGEDYISLLQ